MLARNTLDSELIASYEANARYFRNDLVRAGRSKDFHGASLRKSVLFGSRFLCLYLPDDRLAFPGHDYDAACRATWWTFPFPVICLPKSRVRDQSIRFRSIVEHEMVHATQGLAKRLPSLMLEGDDLAALHGAPQERRVLSVDECTDEVSTHAIAEFEAYFLQMGRWPDEDERPSQGRAADFSLFKWSFARAWVDALNRLLRGAYCNADILSAVLDGIHRRLPSLLASLDAPQEDANWFTKNQYRLVGVIARDTESVGGPATLREVALAWASSAPTSDKRG